MKKRIKILEGGGTVPGDSGLIDPDNIPLNLDDDDDDQGNGDEQEEEEDDNKGGNPNPENPPAPKDNEEEEEDDDTPEAVNHADFVLTQLGYTNKTIDFGDGVEKNVADLTEAEQLEVITGRFEDVVGFYNNRIAELTKNGGSFENEVESVLVQALRDNEYNLTDLVKIISENDPKALAKSATNEDLVTKHLKSIYPDFSDEDIQEELESMSGTSRFDRLASKLREGMMSQQLGEGELAKAIQNHNSTTNAKVIEEFETSKTELNTYMTALKDFNGIPVSDDIKKLLLTELIPESADKDSKFLEGINTPERAVRLSFLDKFHDDIVKNTAEYYFNLGKEEAEKVVSKFKEVPDKITVGARFKKKNQGKKSIEDVPVEM